MRSALPFVFAALVAAAGCRSAKDVLVDYELRLSGGAFAEAAEEPAMLADKGGKDALCWQLNAAAAKRLSGDDEDALRRLDVAEDILIDTKGRGTAATAVDTTVSMMSGDYAMPYPATGQDRIFTCLYKAIDYGVAGRPAAVRTELNRAMLHQQDWLADQSAEIAEAYERVHEDAASYARANGASAADSLATVSNACQDAGFASVLKSNAGFDAARDGRLDLLKPADWANAYLVRVNDTFRRYVGDSGDKPQDMVTVFVEDGLGPVRDEWRVDLPTILVPGLNRYVQYVGMALPKLRYRAAAVTAYFVTAGDVSYQMNEIQDMDRLVKTEFDVAFRGALEREITRAVARAAVQVALGVAAEAHRGHDGNVCAILQLAQLGTALYSYYATEADVRSWAALPKKVYMLDVPRPANGTLTVFCGNETVRLDIPRGNTMAFVRKTSSAAHSVTKVFTLPN